MSMSEDNYSKPNNDEIVIDLREVLNVLKKRRNLIAIGTIICILTSGILSFFVLPPVYEAQVLLLVTQTTDNQTIVQQQQQDDLEGVVNTISRLPIMTMNTYLGQLTSQVILQRVINKLKLDKDLYTPLTLSKQINASVEKNSNLINLSVQNKDPKLAAEIANTLAKEFLQLISEKNAEQMARSVEFLQTQEKKADEDLTKAMDALKNLQSQPQGVPLLQQQFKEKADTLSRYEAQLTDADLEVQQLQAGVAILEKSLNATPKMITVQNTDPSSGRIGSYETSNPVYENISQQLNDKKASLAEKEAQINGLSQVIGEMETELDMVQAELTDKSAQQDSLQREVDRLKKTSDTLAEKTTQTQVAKSMNLGSTSVIIVSDATTPVKPVKPNKKLNIAIAFILGLMVFAMLAFVLEYLDQTIKNTEDVNQKLGLPVLGIIPEIKPGRRVGLRG